MGIQWVLVTKTRKNWTLIEICSYTSLPGLVGENLERIDHLKNMEALFSPKSLSKIIFPLGENFQHSIHQVQLEFSQTFVLAQSSEEKPSFIKIPERMVKTFFAWVFLNEIFCSMGNCLKWTLQAKLEYIRQNVI